MLKFTSVSGSVRAITDIIPTVTTGITPDLITARTIGTADIVIIATIIIGTSLTGIATPGWLEAISGQPNFFERELARKSGRAGQGALFS